jgi:hypothetical protein
VIVLVPSSLTWAGASVLYLIKRSPAARIAAAICSGVAPGGKSNRTIVFWVSLDMCVLSFRVGANTTQRRAASMRAMAHF